MFRWYRAAQICYVYLVDCHHQGRWQFKQDLERYRRMPSGEAPPSRWFTRGWTLQELLAPEDVQFFSSYWYHLGSKDTLVDGLAAVTGIDHYALLPYANLNEVSIARRLSWAADRQTTRPEDRAYCLLGILQINMSLLYSEGDKAFIRLQEETIRAQNDLSIFVWKWPDPMAGLLCSTPAGFRNSQVALFRDRSYQGTITSTSQGFQLVLLRTKDRVVAWENDGIRPGFLALLNCEVGDKPGVFPCIWIRELSPQSRVYRRSYPNHLLTMGLPETEDILNTEGFDHAIAQKELVDVKTGNITYENMAAYNT